MLEVVTPFSEARLILAENELATYNSVGCSLFVSEQNSFDFIVEADSIAGVFIFER